MILVTGATGKIGVQVVRQLLASGQTVRALVRRPDEARGSLGSGVELVPGDLTRPETLDAALRGVDKVFLLSPQGGDPYQLERPLIEAAQRAGVRRLVKLGVLGASPLSPIGFARSHWEAEKLIERSGIPYTFLHPNHLMQHFVSVLGPSIAATDTFYAPMKDGKVSMVDTRDIAAVSVVVLTQSGHEGRVYDITGPDALSYTTAADKLSRALQRRINYVDVPPAAAIQAIVGGGAPEELARDVVALYQCFADGYAATVTDTVPRLIGRRPISFDQFAADNAGAFKSLGGVPSAAPPVANGSAPNGSAPNRRESVSSETNKAIVQRFLKEAWDQGNLGVADELLAPDFRSYAGGREASREEEKGLIGMFLAAFGNFTTKIEKILAEGDKVYLHWSATGTHRAPFAGVAPTGKQVSMSGMEIHRVVNGKIVNIWAEFDMLELLQALGAIPGPAQSAPPDPGEANKATVRRFFAEVLNGQNMASADELVAADFRDYAAPPHPFGSDREFLKHFWPGVFRQSFPDWTITVEDIVAEGDQVVARYTAEGSHQGEFQGIPGSGRRVKVTGMNRFRLANGKISEEWAKLDMVALMQQLTGAPGPAGGPPNGQQAPADSGNGRRLQRAANRPGATEPMTPEEMKALARRGAEECWKLGHLDELDEILAPDYKVYVAGVLTYNGRDAMKRQVTEARAAFPDVEVTVEDLIAQGDKVVARFVFRGTHLGEYKLPGGSMPPTGKRVEVTGIIIFRIANRLIVENREILDTFGMLQQLGVIPAPAAMPA